MIRSPPNGSNYTTTGNEAATPQQKQSSQDNQTPPGAMQTPQSRLGRTSHEITSYAFTTTLHRVPTLPLLSFSIKPLSFCQSLEDSSLVTAGLLPVLPGLAMIKVLFTTTGLFDGQYWVRWLNLVCWNLESSAIAQGLLQ